MQKKRKIIFENNFHNEVKKGIDVLTDAVKTTMGPKGKLVMIQQGDEHPIITKDGVTVANNVNLVNDIQNLGVKVIKEASSRTAEEAGDGTTTSTVLAQSIFNEGLKMKAAGYQMDLMKEGILFAKEKIIDYIDQLKKPITKDEELKNVALISANGEEDISNLIVKAIKKAGAHGSIIVEEAKGYASSLITVNGFKTERGFLSPYFVTDKNKMSCEFKKPLTLLADCHFNSIHKIMKPLELSLEIGRPIVIIANGFENEVLQGLVLNKTKGSLQVNAIKSPGFGSSRHEMMIDLQAILGGTIIDDNFDMKSFCKEDFGSCDKIISTKNTTMFIDNNLDYNSSSVQERILSIKNRLSGYDIDEREKEVLNYRLNQLAGGVCILRVGASTESELIERYDRVDDALNASKAAMQEGILPGGGIALIKAQKMLKELVIKDIDPNIKAGIEIMTRSLIAPFCQILKNGEKNPETAVAKIIKNNSFEYGYDIRKNIFGNMYDLGVIDPHKVVRCALENAVSSATMLLSVGCGMIELNNSGEEYEKE